MNARKGRKRAVCGRKRDNDMAPLSRHFPLKRRLFGETTSRDEVRWECNGGEGGIRTPDSDRNHYNGLANRRLQPLGHDTAKGGI